MTNREYLEFKDRKKDITQIFKAWFLGDHSELNLKAIKDFYKKENRTWIDTPELAGWKHIKPRIDFFKDKLEKYNSKVILDVGSNSGGVANALSNKDRFFDCVDISEAACQLGKETFPHLNFICMDFDDYNTTKKYDTILFGDILEHHQDIQFAIRKAKTLLTDEGVILITIPTFESLTADLSAGGHISALTKKEWTDLGGKTTFYSNGEFDWFFVELKNNNE